MKRKISVSWWWWFLYPMGVLKADSLIHKTWKLSSLMDWFSMELFEPDREMTQMCELFGLNDESGRREKSTSVQTCSLFLCPLKREPLLMRVPSWWSVGCGRNIDYIWGCIGSTVFGGAIKGCAIIGGVFVCCAIVSGTIVGGIIMHGIIVSSTRLQPAAPLSEETLYCCNDLCYAGSDHVFSCSLVQSCMSGII